MTKVKKRKSQSGIVLISTLLSLSLLTMFALTIQAKSIASAKTYRKLIQATEVDAAQAAVRELARPLVLEAMIDFERETQLRLNSTPFKLDWQGRSLTVVAQDVEGMLNIYRPWPEELVAIVPEDVKQLLPLIRSQPFTDLMPLTQNLARTASVSSAPIQLLEAVVSSRGNGINRYNWPNLQFSDRARSVTQPEEVMLQISCCAAP